MRAAGAVRGPGAGAGAREPQPPEPGAAGRGRGDRRRRHRARRRLHGRRGGRRARRAALRRSGARGGRTRATSCAAWCSGIADYGNALGVPNLGGDVVFDAGFDANCLVNVMAVGLGAARRRAAQPRARGPGPWAFVLVGKPTDESGFGGAAFASGVLGGDRPARRGAAARSVPQARARRRQRRGVRAHRARAASRRGFKDLGAGGIACATSELAAAGGARRRRSRSTRVHRVARAAAARGAAVRRDAGALLLGACPGVVRRRAVRDLQRASSRSARVLPGRRRARDRPRARRRRATASRGRARRWSSARSRRSPPGARVRAPGAPRAPPAAPRRARRAGDRPRARRCSRCCGARRCARASTCSATTTARCRAAPGCAPGEARRGRAPRRTASAPLGVAFAVGGNPALVRGAIPSSGARHAVAEAARNVACVGRAAVGAHRLPELRRPRGPGGDGRPRGRRIEGLARRGARRSGGLARAAARRCRS